MARPAKVSRETFVAKYMAAQAAGKTAKELATELGMTPIQFAQKKVAVARWLKEEYSRVLKPLNRSVAKITVDPAFLNILDSLDTVPADSTEA